MAGRIRTIKPEILDDEAACGLSDAAWRLWVSSWVLADDHGRFRAGGRYLAAQVWQDTSRAAVAEAAIEELVRRRFIRRYQVEDQLYAEIKPKGWRAHQKIHNPGQPRVPVPSEDDFLDGERSSGRGRIGNGAESHSAHLQSNPPRDSETLGESRDSSESLGPRACVAARTRGTSDLRPPTSTTDLKETSESAQAPLLVVDPVEESVAPSPAVEIFAAYLDGWRRRVGKGAEPRLTDKRRGLVRARLKDHQVDQLKAAAAGVWMSDWHVENGHTGFELVMRDAGKVEQFASFIANPPKPTTRTHWIQPPAKPGEPTWTEEGAVGNPQDNPEMFFEP